MISKRRFDEMALLDASGPGLPLEQLLGLLGDGRRDLRCPCHCFSSLSKINLDPPRGARQAGARDGCLAIQEPGIDSVRRGHVRHFLANRHTSIVVRHCATTNTSLTGSTRLSAPLTIAR